MSEGERADPPVGAQDEDVQPKSDRLTIKLREQNDETDFKIKFNTKMSKVMAAYYTQKDKAPDTLRFFYDSSRIYPNDTPESLQMEDGDIVDIHIEQLGGEGSRSPGLLHPAPSSVESGETVEDATIIIVVENHRGHGQHYRLNRTTKMSKVMADYSKRTGQTQESLRFFTHDGCRIHGSDTPDTLEMEDGEFVTVQLEQCGGDGSQSPGPLPPPPPGAVGGGEAAETAKITIMVQDNNGNQQHYQIKPSTKMSKVMNVFAEGRGREAQGFRFYTSDGHRLVPDDTPGALEMEDGDVIDVQEEQTGGIGGFMDESESESQDENIPATPKAAESEPEVHNEPETMMVKAREQGGSELEFTIRPGTKMLKVIKAWCKAFGKAQESIRVFAPDGKRCNPQDTAGSCGLVDGDVLDVHMFQTGGRI